MLALLVELRACGADLVDPVRFLYLEALEQRLRIKNLQHSFHWQKLEQAVADYQAKWEGGEQAVQTTEHSQPSPLVALVELLNLAPDEPAPGSPSGLEQRVFPELAADPGLVRRATGTPAPLKAMARAKANQRQLVRQERIRCAIEQIPKDAGPMNAHRLVSRAIAEMQQLSPAYLERFANYTDSLLALERLTKPIAHRPVPSGSLYRP
ncbi:MAG: DUF2894 domain-containing protein [Halomonadaceae bacterium]|nr:MAG: DUF2894 domain-containing protein [Halomonadaceae bacterium]